MRELDDAIELFSYLDKKTQKSYHSGVCLRALMDAPDGSRSVLSITDALLATAIKN